MGVGGILSRIGQVGVGLGSELIDVDQFLWTHCRFEYLYWRFVNGRMIVDGCAFTFIFGRVVVVQKHSVL